LPSGRLLLEALNSSTELIVVGDLDGVTNLVTLVYNEETEDAIIIR
jgi:hypothetical protein